ncbi:damage-control phosphatase [Thermococcus henrietii]|uniref:damage-control phosphatase n=1 Tax=Thermococcus henrietii TaxID=2016361 RepID=UPI000C081240|nr:damage-control phosphatase [Thermococcus henrietii]
MKIHHECVACAINQCQKIVEMSLSDENSRRSAMLFSLKRASELFSKDSIPAVVGGLLFLDLYEFIGNEDPFREYKRVSNEIAKELAGHFKDADLKTALKLAIAGNVVDFSVGYDPKRLEEDIRRVLDESLLIDHSEELFERLKRAGTLLYLVDNCGEIYFDRLFVEKLKEEFPDLRVIVAGKDGPIINDATVVDLREAGFEEVAEVVSTGSRLPGTPIGRVSEEFLGVFRSADVVIAKGQANFETLSELNDSRVFFLLKAKCPAIAREIGVPLGSLLCLNPVLR